MQQVASVDDQRKVLSVSQVNRKIKMMLESEFSSLWLEGEISNFKHHSSGHMYFTVKDERSQISAVFFSRQNRLLKFDLKDGLKVLLYGKVSAYEPRGQYQIYVERVEPKGVGSLQLAFLQLKEKLQKEGLFDEEIKKHIPKFPKRVGVITSPTGAAIRDILNVMQRRFAGTAVLINPVKVQGEGSAEEIARAIEEMNDYGQMDVLIVGRGGGSLEDLWAFNEEVVARAVFASKIPVISAVGHEIDWSICDMVADLRAPTPSAAAELVVENREMLENRVFELRQRMRQSALSYCDGLRDQLDGLSESYAFRQPQRLVEQFSQRLDDYLRQLQNYTKSEVQAKRAVFEAAVGRLEALSPLKILGRGYSLTFKEAKGELLKDSRRLKKGDKITTQLASGKIHSTVERVE